MTGKKKYVVKVQVNRKTTDPNEIIENIKKELKLFARPMETVWKKVGPPAERFISLLERAKELDLNVEELVEPKRFNDTMFSFLFSGIKGQYDELSNIFVGVYKATFLSEAYHRFMYMNDAFWEPLMDDGVILQLPDAQFFEGIMAFVSNIAQISYADTCSGSPYQRPVIEGEYFFVTTYTKAPVLYKAIKRLLHLQEKGFDSSKTKMNVDYDRLITGYFDPRVQTEFWKHKINYPVDLICILMFCFIRLPPIQERVFMDTDSINTIMDALLSKACKQQETMLMFVVENVLYNSKCLSVKLFSHIMKTLNFNIVLSFAIKQTPGKELLRRSAQKTIIETITYRDECKIKKIQCYFPPRKVYTDVDLDVLKEFITNGNVPDKGFGFMIIGDMLEKEEVRDVAIKHGIPKLCVQCLKEMIWSNPKNENNLQTLESTLTVMMRLAHANKDRQRELMKENAIQVVTKYIFHEEEKIRYIAKSTILNMTGRILDAQLELFKDLNFKSLLSEAYDFHSRYMANDETKESYLKVMHVNIAIIRQEFVINHYLTKGNGADNSYINLNEESASKLMEIISYCIKDDRKTLSPTFILLAISSLNYMLIMEKIDISNWLTKELICVATKVSTDHANLAFLKASGNFHELVEKRYSNLPIINQLNIHDVGTSNDDGVKEINFGVKCCWPPCLNYGPSKETKRLGLVRKPLKRCSNCYQVAYCGVTCQKSHWKVHKKECKKADEKIKSAVKKADEEINDTETL